MCKRALSSAAALAGRYAIMHIALLELGNKVFRALSSKPLRRSLVTAQPTSAMKRIEIEATLIVRSYLNIGNYWKFNDTAHSQILTHLVSNVQVSTTSTGSAKAVCVGGASVLLAR